MARGHSEIWEIWRPLKCCEEGGRLNMPPFFGYLKTQFKHCNEKGDGRGQGSNLGVFCLFIFFLLEVKTETKYFTGKTFLPSSRGYQPYKSDFWSALPNTLVPKLLRKPLVFSKHTTISLSPSQNSESWGEDGPPRISPSAQPIWARMLITCSPPTNTPLSLAGPDYKAQNASPLPDQWGLI